MSPTFRPRPIVAADSDDLADLVAQSPDTGRVFFAQRLHAPLVDVVRSHHPQAIGVLVETSAGERVIGSA